MSLFLTVTVGLVIWIVLWALGAKGLDAILLPLLMVVAAVAGRQLFKLVPAKSLEEGTSDYDVSQHT